MPSLLAKRAVTVPSTGRLSVAMKFIALLPALPSGCEAGARFSTAVSLSVIVPRACPVTTLPADGLLIATVNVSDASTTRSLRIVTSIPKLPAPAGMVTLPALIAT